MQDAGGTQAAGAADLRAAALAGGHSCSLGENDQALDRLQTAFDDRSAVLVYLKVDPAFDTLPGGSRFAGLLQRIRF